MRLTFLTFFLCTGVTAMCQSVATAPMMPNSSLENALNKPAWADNMKLSPELSIPGFAPLTEKRQFDAPKTWRWNDTLGVPKSISPPQWSIARQEPIPTQWPNFTFHQIPTVWPNLKMVLIASQINPPATLQAQLQFVR